MVLDSDGVSVRSENCLMRLIYQDFRSYHRSELNSTSPSRRECSMLNDENG